MADPEGDSDFRQEYLPLWGGGFQKYGLPPTFKFEGLKWPILTEVTAIYEIYFHFVCQQGGITRSLVPRGRGGDRLVETLRI